ncbi:unnamed protein product [Adineta ricciae]|uniref:SHSP domain-containing protein n=1 Tax=Adineta ricciae TaxID=249248 RepID=A0A815JSU8_ADIRI|nr:unnamed protein product [Adineta ricciae]
MSTSINRSSSLPRPYIGSRRSRHYIYNNLPSTSLLSNDYFLSSKSFLSNTSKPRTYIPNDQPSESLQERNDKDFISSSIPLADRQLCQGRKTRDFLSSSSSLFLLPSTPNKTSHLCHDPCSSSFVKEQQKAPSNHLYESRYSHCQSLNSTDKTLAYQSPVKQYSIDNYQTNLLEEKSSLPSSSRLLNDSIVVNKESETSFLPSSFSLHYPKSTNSIFSSSPSTNKINDHKPLSKISNNTFARPPSSFLRYSTSSWNINSPMSSTKYPTGSDGYTGPITHSYDQRISDQGTKYVIQLTTDDFEENEFTITPSYSRNQLVIDGKHVEEDHLGGFIRREMHKIFPIPKHIDLTRYSSSYSRKTRELTIEMPCLHSTITEKKPNLSNRDITSQSLTFSYGNLNLTNGGRPTSSATHLQSDPHHNLSINPNDFHMTFTDSSRTTPVAVTSNNDSSVGKTKPFDFDVFHRSAFRPQILPGSSNDNKKLLMSLDLTDYQPEDIQVSIKDQELIVKAERKTESDTRKSRSSFFQSTSLPPQTDIERLQSNYMDGKLIIEAPYLEKHVKIINNNTDING